MLRHVAIGEQVDPTVLSQSQEAPTQNASTGGEKRMDKLKTQRKYCTKDTKKILPPGRQAFMENTGPRRTQRKYSLPDGRQAREQKLCSDYMGLSPLWAHIDALPIPQVCRGHGSDIAQPWLRVLTDIPRSCKRQRRNQVPNSGTILVVCI